MQILEDCMHDGIVKFAPTIPWDIIRILLGLAALASLLRKVDILHIVLVGASISVVIL